MASFYKVKNGFLHEDAFESDGCPSPESRQRYDGIEDLEAGDVIHDGPVSITVTAEMIAAARAEKAGRA